MNQSAQDDIAQKVRDYDAAFDFCMEHGQLPVYIPQDDLLGGFIVQTIKDNPQLDSQEPLWIELLKEEMMKFIEVMLQLFQPIEEHHQKEQKFIAAFASSDLPQKRSMWGQAVQVMRSQYKPEELNLDGYIEQLMQSGTEGQKETILDTLAKDWERASEEKKEKRKRNLLKTYQKRWEQDIREHGGNDYRERREEEKFFHSYPQLVEIVRIIGREQPKREDEIDDTVRRYLPLLPSPPKPAAEIEEIANGNDLQHLLPSETAIMSEAQTESLFYYKFATNQLQLFANRPKNESQFKKRQTQMKKPRLENGPIIVAVDTSGSMDGKPLKIAYSLLTQLLRMARRKKRRVFLLTFSVRSKSLDLSMPSNWLRLKDFLKDRFTGGTDGEQMLNKAVEMLQTNTFGMADVLIISDFDFPLPLTSTRDKMLTEHDKGTRFYGLRINSGGKAYDKILDKIWDVKWKGNYVKG